MTLAGRLVAIFPLLHALLIGVSAVLFIQSHDLAWLGAFVFAIYFFPVLIFRIHNLFFPLNEGTYDLGEKRYNIWWTSYQLQFLFISFPLLETIWHLIPGGFSFWLRLWGSKVGKNVFWTPRVEIIDRGLLDVGDNVVVGHVAAFCSHAITPKKGKLLLIVKKVNLGAGSFIGAASQFGPGATALPGEMVSVKSARYWKGEYQ
jgi:hypothetical protein